MSSPTAFWKAFVYTRSDSWRPIESRLAIFEVLEALFERKRDERYRELIVELAQRLQRIEPHAYAYAFEAKYATTKAERVRALAYALYLDRKSLRIRQFTDQQKHEALTWWAQENPFARSNRRTE
jgi:hypothetical protein